ncbi:hypothetical protein XGA_1927 [Xanthomonas hortorum ATCC 19865]|nr:hypothetical protein XGA_1927 [Xanthomonas hortorum ATCC 19865]
MEEHEWRISEARKTMVEVTQAMKEKFSTVILKDEPLASH